MEHMRLYTILSKERKVARYRAGLLAAIVIGGFVSLALTNALVLYRPVPLLDFAVIMLCLATAATIWRLIKIRASSLRDQH